METSSPDPFLPSLYLKSSLTAAEEARTFLRVGFLFTLFWSLLARNFGIVLDLLEERNLPLLSLTRFAAANM